MSIKLLKLKSGTVMTPPYGQRTKGNKASEFMKKKFQINIWLTTFFTQSKRAALPNGIQRCCSLNFFTLKWNSEIRGGEKGDTLTYSPFSVRSVLYILRPMCRSAISWPQHRQLWMKNVMYRSVSCVHSSSGHMRMYPKVSGLATWSENCKWCSSPPLGAVVSLFYESV